jgi:hypothetical protein
MSRGHLFLRVEHQEWEFLSKLDLDAPVPFDAAVISDRYLAAYPEGHRDHGKPADRLVEALDELHVPWLLDPDTARLGHHRAAERLRPRAANSPIVRALALPLTPSLSMPSGEAEALVDAAAGVQLRSTMFTAPYLEFAGTEDPRFATNLRLLELVRERAGDRTVVAVLQTTARYLRDGSAAEAGRALAACGAKIVLIRIRRFAAEEASSADLVAYGRAAIAIERAGASAIPDAVGRLGPVLVACGADGFSTGAYHFRSVPADLCPDGGGAGQPALSWEVPDRFTSIERSTVRLAAERATCRYPRCPAPTGTEPESAIRAHNLHELQRLARLAAQEGFSFAGRLRASGSVYASGWAVGLEQLQRLAA